jgi:hypothetical protein
MTDDKDQRIMQIVNGDGNAVAAVEHATATSIKIFGIPIDQFVTSFLIGSIILQSCGYIFGLFRTSDPSFSVLVCGLCFPVFFGIPSFFGLVFGIARKNIKMVLLSVISGFCSVGIVLLFNFISIWDYFKIIDFLH